MWFGYRLLIMLNSGKEKMIYIYICFFFRNCLCCRMSLYQLIANSRGVARSAPPTHSCKTTIVGTGDGICLSAQLAMPVPSCSCGNPVPKYLFPAGEKVPLIPSVLHETLLSDCGTGPVSSRTNYEDACYVPSRVILYISRYSIPSRVWFCLRDRVLSCPVSYNQTSGSRPVFPYKTMFPILFS